MRRGDPVAGVAAVAVAGCGSTALLAGWAGAAPLMAVGGGVAAAAALAVLLAVGWLGGLLLLAAVLALPAPYESPAVRVSAAAALTAVVLAGWLLRWGGEGGRPAVEGLPLGWMAALGSAAVLASIFALSPLSSLVELTTVLLLLGLLVAATDELVRGRTTSEELVRALALVAGAAGPVAALEAAGVIPGRFPLAGTGLHRATLGFGWPNELGMYFALSVPLAVHQCRIARGLGGRTFWCAVLAGTLVGLGATFSRGSWFAVPVGAGILVAVGAWRKMLGVWGVGLVAAVAVDLASGGAVLARIQSLPGDWVVEQRAALTLTGLLMFRAHPVLGVGPGGFAEHMESFGAQVSWLWDLVGSAHNTYVQVAAEMGILGLAALLGLGGALFIAMLRGARRARSDESIPPAEADLRLTLLWCFGILMVLGALEWVPTHGVGQLAMLLVAAGVALDVRRDRSSALDAGRDRSSAPEAR